MRVKATRKGYYGHRIRKEGDVFDLLKKEHLSKNWMVEVKKGAKASKPEPEPELDELEGEETDEGEEVI